MVTKKHRTFAFFAKYFVQQLPNVRLLVTHAGTLYVNDICNCALFSLSVTSYIYCATIETVATHKSASFFSKSASILAIFLQALVTLPLLSSTSAAASVAAAAEPTK